MMSAAGYRESLRACKPRVFVDGSAVPSVADEPLLPPGITGVGVIYDFALRKGLAPIMTARQGTSGKTVNRLLHINESSQDLLSKLEALRLVCKTSGCAQRCFTHDAVNGVYQSTRLTDDRHGTDYSQRFLAYLHDIQHKDLALSVAMADAKGDRSKCPGKQINQDVYVHVKELRKDGIVGAPYEIWCNHPVMEKLELVEGLLDRGILDEGGACRSIRSLLRDRMPDAEAASAYRGSGSGRRG